VEEVFVAGVGASAGGVKALKEFFRHVPASGGLAYVGILHLSPEYESRLHEVLQVECPLPVVQVHERVRMERDHVYVISPNQSLTMMDGYLASSAIMRQEERRAPVDIFFRTLADARGSNSACVVLSGSGSDGSSGLKRIKERGGICFAQDPAEAEHPDMPRNAIATGLVDHVLPVAEIAQRIVSYRRSLGTVRVPDDQEQRQESEERAIREIFSQLRARTGHDFINYKRSTMSRRLERRVAVHGLPDLQTYAQFLRDNPDEAQALLKDLLISVTNFFRDREAFEALEARVIPKLFEGKTEEDHVRVWVAGCATGEEAYSIAMLLAERNANAVGGPLAQVFATDIDDNAIAVAREAMYAVPELADVSPERLRRFFVKEGEYYRVRKDLREMVLFARHNVIKDPPFSHLDLVSCRNLLIYLNRPAQQRVMDLLHFGLRPGGFLFLGSSESVDGAGSLFVNIDKDANIYQSRGVALRTLTTIPEATPVVTRLPPAPPDDSALTRPRKASSYADLHQRLLEEYAPPSVVVDDEHEILHLSDGAARYLQFPAGDPSANLLKVIRPELRLEARTALYQAAQSRTPVEARNLRLVIDGSPVALSISVHPVLREGDTARGFFLVLFEPADAESTTVEEPATIEPRDAARQLEDEVQRLRTQLRATVQQHEIQSEELKASNEELHAINEELRSTAEELETSKEELQSVNEELTTVNQELKIKIDEQTHASNDIQNLINTSEIAAVFLDRGSRIKLFTPRAREIFNLIPGDRGRPLSDISGPLEHERLQTEINRVLERLERLEREVQTRDGRWHMMQIVPYRTADDRIDGVVLTFVDVTQRKESEARVAESERRFRAIVSQTTAGIAYLDRTGTALFVNDRLAEMVGWTPAEAAGATIRDLIADSDAAPDADRFGQLIAQGTPFEIERRLVRRDGTTLWVNVSLSPIRGADGAIESAAAVMLDLSERKRMEDEWRHSEAHLRSVLESIVDHAIITVDQQGKILEWNVGAERLFGYGADEAIGQSAALIFTPEDRAKGAHLNEIQTAQRTGRASDERWHQRKDGSRLYASGVLRPIGPPPANTFVKVARDLTDRKQNEDALQHAHDQLESAVAARTVELRGLLGRLITVQEDERRRIARDLHDDIGQKMTALHLKLEALRRAQPAGSLLTQVEEAQAFVQQLDRDLDFFTWELRPAALYDLGLGQALRDFVAEWSKNYNIAAEFQEVGGNKERLRADFEIHFYRIAQEALNNVFKHAKATNVDVVLQRRDGEIVLTIEDNGVGFGPGQPMPHGGRGLVNMRERAALMDGTLEIERGENGGTAIIVRAPAVWANG
jgi:two-component system CheB/CheR fusion protein